MFKNFHTFKVLSKATFKNEPHAKSTFLAICWTCSRDNGHRKSVEQVNWNAKKADLT